MIKNIAPWRRHHPSKKRVVWLVLKVIAQPLNGLVKKLLNAAKKEGVTEVVFDRGSYRFHGRVKVLADAARSGGLSF